MLKWLSVLVVCVGSVAMTARVTALAEPSTQPSGEKAKSEKSGRGGAMRWGYAPFNKLSNVTDEQRAKISEIHRKFVAERRALEDKQEADVMALLTDDQKVELDKLKAEEKAKQADRRKGSKDKEEDADKDK